MSGGKGRGMGAVVDAPVADDVVVHNIPIQIAYLAEGKRGGSRQKKGAGYWEEQTGVRRGDVWRTQAVSQRRH